MAESKEDPIPTKIWNKRIVSVQTHWWASETFLDPSTLFCVHKVPLTKDCKECNA